WGEICRPGSATGRIGRPRHGLQPGHSTSGGQRITKISFRPAAKRHNRQSDIVIGGIALRFAMATYDAFVSYSHAKDKPIAAALQAVMQRLGKPWYRRRALRVFRDDTSLSATPGLWPSIEQALDRSRFLVLLASPEAAASPWVNKEISFWLDRKNV